MIFTIAQIFYFSVIFQGLSNSIKNVEIYYFIASLPRIIAWFGTKMEFFDAISSFGLIFFLNEITEKIILRPNRSSNFSIFSGSRSGPVIENFFSKFLYFFEKGVLIPNHLWSSPGLIGKTLRYSKRWQKSETVILE